jgi:hypothetical protein
MRLSCTARQVVVSRKTTVVAENTRTRISCHENTGRSWSPLKCLRMALAVVVVLVPVQVQKLGSRASPTAPQVVPGQEQVQDRGFHTPPPFWGKIKHRKGSVSRDYFDNNKTELFACTVP